MCQDLHILTSVHIYNGYDCETTPWYVNKFVSNRSVLTVESGLSARAKLTSLLLAASANASCAEKVLLPTPPFPDKTRILCLMFRMRCSMAIKSGSGPFGAVAQIS